ncbi:methyltransferase domain-containing protein [Streptosporangiaceae bacterium NEAU-GS5]|nr:methyltransferase domain-containing protein [Streptosporangiaceae bacterium NEAU-GS5]
MTFDVTADAYGRFMGRYAEPLAVRFADLADVTSGQRALDVGCGPGALTAELVRRLGAGAVAAVDPSEPFLVAIRERLPGVDVQRGAAEQLPFPDDTFDVTLSQLVVHFMADPVAGVREMARVTRPGGLVAACVWDHAGDGSPLSLFWRAAGDLDPEAPNEAFLAGAREGHLVELFEQAGVHDLKPAMLSVRVIHPTFEEWWDPFLLGVGPAGAYVAGLDDEHRERLREHCQELLPTRPIPIDATAWAVHGKA